MPPLTKNGSFHYDPKRIMNRLHEIEILSPKQASVEMAQKQTRQFTEISRRSFIGGSDVRIIMGNDEAALIRLWREKRGEAESDDLSGNLIVQLGNVTEELNRSWYE